MPNTEVSFLAAGVDCRDYSVDFSKITKSLSFKTEFSVPGGIAEIRERLSHANGINIADPRYINEQRIRQLISEMRVNGKSSASMISGLIGNAA
jgi:hypothetical protein